MTTSPRPTLDETLARIDAVLTEPTPDPLDDHHLQVVTRHLERPPLAVHRSANQFADRIGQLEWAAGPPPTEDQQAAFRAVDAVFRARIARAIGWFRR